MKKIGLLSFMLAGVMLASCSDDKETEDVALQAAGTYNGYTVASCAYFSGQMTPDQTVSVVYAAPGKVTVGLESDTWGNIMITGADVTSSGGSLIITGSGVTEMGMEGTTAKEYTCDVAGKITGGKADLEFKCQQVMGGLTIMFHTGDMPQQ